MEFSSKLIEDAVREFSRLPGIGQKTALRLVLFLLKTEPSRVDDLANTMTKMRREIRFCVECHNISDGEVCAICANPGRNRQQLCIVESIRDVIAIENTKHYSGRYHVLGGILSPLDGIGPEQLNLTDLADRIRNSGITEIIMAISPTIEGDTTVFYISKLLKDIPVTITTIARGISLGGDLEYADEMTLAKSIAKRLPVENYVNIR